MTRPALTLGLVRRSLQVSVLALLVLVPAVARYNNYLSARELDRVLERWEGTGPGILLGSIDAVARRLPGAERERAGRMQRDRLAVLSSTQRLRGSAWSMQIGSVSITDPLAAAESVAASKRFPAVLAWSLLVPLAITLLLGRVFCSWICPVGFVLELNDKARGLLKLLELRPRNLRFARAAKYALLGVGLVLAAAASAPVLGYVYPPAIFSRETHDAVFAWFDRAELGRTGVGLESLSWMSVILIAIVVVEIALSRRWWCRYLCPGGALYSLLGWARPVRVRLLEDRCTDCALCVSACPMGLNPMKNEMGIECDNCGVCIASCADAALAYGVKGPMRASRVHGPVASPEGSR